MATGTISITVDGLEDIAARITRMENLLTTQAEAIAALTARFEGVAGIAADILADVRALLATVTAERENLTAEGQAALDLANTRAQEAADKLAELDTTVGDADGSDTPPPPPPVVE